MSQVSLGRSMHVWALKSGYDEMKKQVLHSDARFSLHSLRRDTGMMSMNRYEQLQRISRLSAFYAGNLNPDRIFPPYDS